MQNTLEQLLEEISFRRKKDMRVLGHGVGQPGHGHGPHGQGQADHHSTTYWTDLFVRHFLFQTDYEVDRDDLLFFIRKTAGRYRQQSVVEVRLWLHTHFLFLKYLFGNRTLAIIGSLYWIELAMSLL